MKRIHFLGIGGSGASAIAAIAQSEGYIVTGCDKQPVNEFTTGFKEDQLLIGHSKDHLKNIDALIITPAILSLDPNNEELVCAQEQNIPILTWQEFMGKNLEKDERSSSSSKFVIAICGTHGKSTTTAMIAKVLEDAGLDPTVELGAIIPEWGKNYRIGRSKYFITEADEFNDNFLSTTPDLTVVTSLEMDHPEYFKDLESYKDSFIKFLSSTKTQIFANLNYPHLAEVIKWVMKESSVSAIDYTKTEVKLDLKMPGDHNRLNALAAFQIGLFLGIEPQKIITSLNNLKGLSRRFEYIGEYKGAKVYSDFAHNPTKVEVTLKTAREQFPNSKIIAFYQPHMFSRTKALYDDFVRVFRKSPVDKVVIIDIYPSREVDTGLIKSEQLVGTINKENVIFNSAEEIKETLAKEVNKGDVVFFIGAGDIDTMARKIIEK